MKHVFKKTIAGSSLLLALMFSLTAHAGETQQEFYNVKIESFSAERQSSGAQTRYVITWANGACKGFSGDSSMMSMLKTAYILKENINYLHCGCKNGDILALKIQ